VRFLMREVPQQSMNLKHHSRSCPLYYYHHSGPLGGLQPSYLKTTCPKKIEVTAFSVSKLKT
jgi:hypothetical protein